MSITIFALMTVGQWFDIISDICLPSIVYRILLYRMRVHVLLTNKNIYQALEYTDKLRNEGRKMGKDKEQKKDKDKDKDKGVEKLNDKGYSDKEQGSVKEHNKDKDQGQDKHDDHHGSDKIIDEEDHCQAENNENKDAEDGADDMPNTHSNGGISGGSCGSSRSGKGHRNKDHNRVLRAVVDKRLTLLTQVMISDD